MIFDQSAQDMSTTFDDAMAMLGTTFIEFAQTPRADLTGNDDTTVANAGGRINDPKPNPEPA
jgi:hypothetical protein